MGAGPSDHPAVCAPTRLGCQHLLSLGTERHAEVGVDRSANHLRHGAVFDPGMVLEPRELVGSESNGEALQLAVGARRLRLWLHGHLL